MFKISSRKVHRCLSVSTLMCQLADDTQCSYQLTRDLVKIQIKKYSRACIFSVGPEILHFHTGDGDSSQKFNNR